MAGNQDEKMEKEQSKICLVKKEEEELFGKGVPCFILLLFVWVKNKDELNREE